MRILVVSPHYWPEPFRVADLAAGLVERGHHVEILTTLPHYPAGRFYDGYGLRGPYTETHRGILVHRVPVVPRGDGGAVRLLLNYLTFAVSAAIAGLRLGRRGWNVIFVFQVSPVTAIFPAAVMRALHGIPVVTWIQDLWPETLRSVGPGRSRVVFEAARVLSGWLYGRSDLLLGASRAYLPYVERLGVPASRFEYLPQWTEAATPTPSASVSIPPGPSFEGFPLLFAGNLGRVQGLDTLLAAADLLRDLPDIHWVFLGDGSRRDWLVQEIARRGLERTVFYLGRRPSDEMPAFYGRAAALLVSLDPDEAMALTVPGKVQSVLAAGRPVVGSIDGEGRRVLSESGAGVTAPAGDARGLAEIVMQLRDSPAERRAEMGRAGQEYARASFDRSHCLDDLVAHLERAARRQTPAGV